MRDKWLHSERESKIIHNKKLFSLSLSPLTEVNVFDLFPMLAVAVSLVDDLSSFSVNFRHEESVTSWETVVRNVWRLSTEKSFLGTRNLREEREEQKQQQK